MVTICRVCAASASFLFVMQQEYSVPVPTPCIGAVLSPERTRIGFSGGSSKKVLENVAEFIAARIPGIDARELFYRLVGRERKGSTGLGNGIAIPHCRIANCPGTYGALLRLAEPVDFADPSGVSVDLLFVLLVPEENNEEHLQVLAMLARLFDDKEVCAALRAAQTDQELYRAATGGPEA